MATIEPRPEIPFKQEGSKFILGKGDSEIKVKDWSRSFFSKLASLLSSRVEIEVVTGDGQSKKISVTVKDLADATGLSNEEIKQAAKANTLETVLSEKFQNILYKKLEHHKVGISSDTLNKLYDLFEKNKDKWTTAAQLDAKGKTSEQVVIGGKQYKIKTVMGQDRVSVETYVKVKELGKGGFGAVNLALNMTRMELMAQKSSRLRNPFKVDVAQREVRIIKEAEEMRGGPIPGLIHYHNVSYYVSKKQPATEAGKEPAKEPAVVKQRLFMSLCDVGEITNLFSGKMRVNDAEFCNIAATALDGLAALHETDPQTVHGDIKRENVMIQSVRDPKNWKAPPKKIGVVIDAQGAYRPTEGQQLNVHTPQYLSPESLLHTLYFNFGVPKSLPASPGPSTDVWAMGCTLFEASLKREAPWVQDVERWLEIMNSKREGDNPKLQAQLTRLEESVKAYRMDDSVKAPLLTAIQEARLTNADNILDLTVKLIAYIQEQAKITQGTLRRGGAPKFALIADMLNTNPTTRITARQASTAFRALATVEENKAKKRAKSRG